MAYLPTNSTSTLLLANQEFIGEPVAVDKEYISVTCSFNSNVGGVLSFFHSIDGFSYSNYGDIYDFTSNPGSHSIEVSVKGKYFKIRYINGSENQSVFNLFCKLNLEVAEAILNATYDTITVFAGGSGLNIRQLTTDDKVSIPRLEQTLTTDSGVSALQCKITSMPAIVIPPITISDINIHDSSGGDILANSSGYLQTEIMNSSLSVSGSVSVSNQISGFALNTTVASTNSKLDSLITGTRIQASNGNEITVDANKKLYVNTGLTSLFISNEILSITGHVDETNSLSILAGITGIQSQLTTLNNGITGSVHILEWNSGITVNNFPAGISHVNIDNVVGVTGSISILEWNSGITVNNFPEGISHVNIDNVVGVTGSISILEWNSGITVNNFPEGISHVNIDNVVGITGSISILEWNSGITVNNFPEGISHVNIDNEVSVTGDFYPDIQQISGNVGITGVVEVSGTVEATGFPTEFPIYAQRSDNSVVTSLLCDPNAHLETHINGSIDNTSFIIQAKEYVGATAILHDLQCDENGQLMVDVVSIPSGITGPLSKLSFDNGNLKTLTYGSGYDGTTNALFVDVNGFVTSNVVTAQHENIYLGVNLIPNLTVLSLTNYLFYTHGMLSILTAISNSTNGWLYKNVISSNPSYGSLCWYNNGDFSTYSFANQSDIQFKDLDVFYIILQNWNPSSQSNIQMNVYSKATGSGDYSPGNYKSKWNYTLVGSPYIATGQSYMIYHGLLARLKLNDPEVPRIQYEYNLVNSQGSQQNTEIIRSIELVFTDLVGGVTFSVNIVEGGLYSKTGHLLNYYFDNEINSRNEIVGLAAAYNNLYLTYNEANSLQTNLSNDGTNYVDIISNSGTANLKNKYGLVTDSVLYAKNSTGDMINVGADASGNLNVNIASGSISLDKVKITDSAGATLAAVSSSIPNLRVSLYDALGNPGTMTNNALDVNLKTSSTTLNIKDSAGGSFLCLNAPTSCVGAIKSVLYGTFENEPIGDTQQTYESISKVGLNNFIINTPGKPAIVGGSSNGTDLKVLKTDSSGYLQVGITGTPYVGITGTPYVGISTGANTIKIDQANNGVELLDSSNSPISTNSSSSTLSTTQNVIMTGNVNYNKDLINNLFVQNTATSQAGTTTNFYAMDTYVKNPTTTNDYSRVGLNVYNITPKRINYVLSGQNTTNSTNMLFGGVGCTTNFSLASFGKAFSRNWYASKSSGIVRDIILTYDYVNSTGDLVQNQTYTLTTTHSILVNCVSINKWSINTTLGSGETVYISYNSVLANALAGGTFPDYYNGVITVPNGYIGYLTQYSCLVGTPLNIFILKWDVNGNRVPIYVNYNSTNLSQVGSPIIGTILTAGESIAVGRTVASTQSYFYGNFVLEAI